MSEQPTTQEMTDMATRKAANTATKEAAPKTKAKAAPKTEKAAVVKTAAAPVEFGSAWLVDHVNTEAGTSYTASTLRILLRKLTKDGVLSRDSEGRARYSFPKGANDPQVKAIVKAVKGGAAEKAKQERLDDLKAKRTTKKTAAPAKKSRKAKAAPEPEEDDDDLDVDEI